MNTFNIEVDGGKTVRLPTGGKYCPRDILVTATKGDAGGYDEGYAAGQVAEYDRFWDSCQSNGNRRNYYYWFAYPAWNDVCFNPKYAIICEGGSTNGQNVFYNNSSVTRIPVDIIVNGISAKQIFYRCTNLKTVKKLVLNGVTDLANAFVGCSELEEIEIEGSIDVNFNISATDVLSGVSVQSVIDHLAPLDVKDGQTLTLHETVGSKLTETQKATITAKNWKLVY